MSNYVTLPFNKKLNLLREHSVTCDWADLDEEQWCLHCGLKFNGHSARVWEDDQGGLWLECGTPDCDGSPIDWAPSPWWDPKHPATQNFLKKPPSGKRGPRRSGPPGDDIPF